MGHKYVPNLSCLFGCFKPPKLLAAPSATGGNDSPAPPAPGYDGSPVPFATGDDDSPVPFSTGHDESPDEKFICRECRQVDWDSLVAQDEHLECGIEPLVLRNIAANHEELATSSCKICRILSVVKPPTLDDTECVVGARPVFHFSGAYAMQNLWPECKTTALHVCQRGKDARGYIQYDKCLAVIRRDSLDCSSRTITPKLMDYDWLKRVAQSCEESHEGTCRPSSLHPVSGLKVIEASSRTVIKAPAECRYVALSYVWGKQPDVAQVASSRLQNLPPLIEDALSITITMGYKYLWIDRYCIPQTNNQERHHIINQMGNIYANASLTIIKASKEDIQSGLPGVSSFTRQPQKYVYIRNIAILELPYGEHKLNCSSWATRGWTYQEGYFSKRRLIFTPSQILFLCNRSYAEESVCRLLQQAFTAPISRKFLHLIDPSSNHGRGGDCIEMLKEYSKRRLTFPVDSLNAFLGILNFEIDRSRRLREPILHVSCGLFARRWGSEDCLRVYLNWYHESPASRRSEFPTWSWAGWGGPLTFHMHDSNGGFPLYRCGDHPRRQHKYDWEIFWGSRDHDPVSIWEFTDYHWSRPHNTDKLQLYQKSDYPSRLEVTCFVVPIRFQVVSLTDNERAQKTEIQLENPMQGIRVGRRNLPTENVPVLQFVEGVHIAIRGYLDAKINLHDCIIGLIYAGEFGISLGCILARKVREGVYERVGAIPDLMEYDEARASRDTDGSDGSNASIDFPECAFMDDTGSILNEVRLSIAEIEEGSLFSGGGGRRTVSLV